MLSVQAYPVRPKKPLQSRLELTASGWPAPFILPEKPVSGRLARPCKRHYTFARWLKDQFVMIGVRHGATAASTR
jgi:hypothetical protein